MYCRVLACDFDGTGATSGQLAPEMVEALGTARACGIAALLVTGRMLEDVRALCPDLSIFDAVVVENGAVVYLPESGRTIHLGVPPPDQFLGELRARGVPFQVGSVVVGTWDRHAAQALESIRRCGLDSQPVFNRDTMMLLPSGINKAVGTRRALQELGRSAHNLIAFGDAENDLPLLALAEVGVAARGAVPTLVAQADDQLTQPGGVGVAQYIHRLLEQGGHVPTPPRHQIVLGSATDGTAAVLPGSGMNVMITGDPRSGKSWLAGLVAEQLLERGYRLCIIDPEGDYLSLGKRPHVLVLGSDLSLPDPAAVSRILRDQPLNLVLNLAQLPLRSQAAFVNAVLCELETGCAATGIPQWILVDEAQYFFHETAAFARRFGGAATFLFATYRPSLVSDVVYAAVRAHLLTRTAVEEERYFITGLLQARGPCDLVVGDALAELGMGRAGLLIEDPSHPRWQIFTPGGRVIAQAHHARKYADGRLPEDKAFRFLCTDGAPVVAHNALEFHHAVQSVPIASLRHHLGHGDFSCWASAVLGDEMLAHDLRRLERTVQAGGTPDRTEILTLVEDQYLIEPGLAVEAF